MQITNYEINIKFIKTAIFFSNINPESISSNICIRRQKIALKRNNDTPLSRNKENSRVA